MKIMANRMDRGFFRHQEEYESKALEVLRSGWYVLGNEVKSFEEEYAAYTGGNLLRGYWFSGLDALWIAFRLLGIGKGDEVIVQTRQTLFVRYCLKIGGKLMKKKLMKRVISILLSVAVLCCAAGAEGLLISAENRYDITLTITYPRSGEAPEIPSDFESLSSLDLTYLGCEWKTADDTEQWDDGTEFIEWMYTFVNSRNYNSLNTFEDGIMYHQRTYFKIANVSVSGEEEAAVTLVDSATNQQFNSSEVYLINGEELISELGGAVALPSGITANDSLIARHVMNQEVGQ